MNENAVIKIPSTDELKDTYTRTFKMQGTGADGETIRVSVPRDVVRREANRHHMTITQFLKHFRIEWRYNGFPGFYGSFVPIETPKANSED